MLYICVHTYVCIVHVEMWQTKSLPQTWLSLARIYPLLLTHIHKYITSLSLYTHTYIHMYVDLLFPSFI